MLIVERYPPSNAEDLFFYSQKVVLVFNWFTGITITII